jgi:hypothetical protein
MMEEWAGFLRPETSQAATSGGTFATSPMPMWSRRVGEVVAHGLGQRLGRTADGAVGGDRGTGAAERAERGLGAALGGKPGERQGSADRCLGLRIAPRWT